MLHCLQAERTNKKPWTEEQFDNIDTANGHERIIEAKNINNG
jgi:hypothetical protein